MASSTKKTENIRKAHARSRGKWNRRQRRAKGSTPAFPIHVTPAAPATSAQS